MKNLKLRVLKKILKQMTNDAEDKGKPDFCIQLTVDDEFILRKLHSAVSCVKLGDTVWFNTYTPDGTCIGILPHKITKIKTSVMVEGKYFDTELSMDLFNEIWFLTKKEAERSENIGKN